MRETAPKGTRRRRTRCQHHWLIDRPSGATSKGRCKHCGRVRKFSNVPEEASRPFTGRSKAAG